MRRIKLLLMIILFAAANAVAQERNLNTESPKRVLFNIGSAIYDVALDDKLFGVTERTDALGNTKVEVQLNNEKRILIRILDRKTSYRGKYELLASTALVSEWDNWSQDSALSALKAEIDWRVTTPEYTLLVNENDRRVYVTEKGINAVKKIGGLLTGDEFTLPSSKYVHNLRKHKGAAIFDSSGSGSNLVMRLIDDRGRDTTFSIKKSGEISPTTPKKIPRHQIVGSPKTLG